MKIPKIYAPNAFENGLDMFRSFFAEQVNNGAVFKDGETVQLGWILFRVKKTKGNTRIQAPFFFESPIKFVDDCSDALNIVMLQKYMTESFGAPLTPCHLGQSVIAIKDLDQCDSLFMDRADPSEDHSSGWFIGSEDSQLDANKAENLELRGMWEIFCRHPMLGEFFMFPPGWQVVFADRPVVLQNFEAVTPLPGSYYEAAVLNQG